MSSPRGTTQVARREILLSLTDEEQARLVKDIDLLRQSLGTGSVTRTIIEAVHRAREAAEATSHGGG